MKHILKIFLVCSTLVVAQDSTMNVEKEPSLPGWGVYVGGAFGNATAVDDLPDGTNLESRLVLPNIGVSKGLMLGSVPLIVGFGYHPRGYKYKATGDYAVEADYQIDMLDFWATVPYPVSDRAILQAGFLVGTCLGGKVTIDGDDTDLEDIEGEPDFGIMLGGGFAITEQVGVNCGYYIGLAEFDDQMKFNGLIFNLGYNF
ncbi:outer membrane beta-barrel protein [Candidatus Marinimicrobia bacterium]|nr:outer membrane beta-barrel protein [Candidatus Neomarinimicrobiota bacterium]